MAIGAWVLRKPDVAMLNEVGVVPAAGVMLWWWRWQWQWWWQWRHGLDLECFWVGPVVPHCRTSVTPLSHLCHATVTPLSLHLKRIRKEYNGMIGRGLNICYLYQQ